MVDMIKFEGKMQFVTTRAISQQTGLEMWKLGSHFQALTGHGGRTYQLTTNGEASSLAEAALAVSEAIRDLIAEDGHNSCEVTLIDLQVRAA
jgi:uncharacterized protein YqjF (DUF2071 family)